MSEQNLWQKFIWFSERAILMIIAIATLFATGIELVRMISSQTVNLSDLFLLFIYHKLLQVEYGVLFATRFKQKYVV